MIRFHLTLLLAILGAATLSAQDVEVIYLSETPEPITNNAISGAVVDGKQFLYSFTGISDISSCGNAHLKSFKYDVEEDEWTQIGDLPDTTSTGVIAAGASTINNEIYIVGGYHVFPNCQEITSPSLMKFNPLTEKYTHLAPVPVPVDDHVQVVYKDSLLMLVTGWSSTTNVANVQIYNPATNEWKAGTSVSQSGRWRVFGASGSIVGDTLYYVGGASPTCNSSICFPPTKYMRKGYINPSNPYEIEWTGYDAETVLGYRMGASTYKGLPIWFGGADHTYNFDAIDYTESTVVQPNQSLKYFKPSSGEFVILDGVFPSIMDFRGVVKIGDGDYMLVGGIGVDQEVVSSTIRVVISTLTSTKDHFDKQNSLVYPNPVISFAYIERAELGDLYDIIDNSGKVLSRITYTSKGLDLTLFPKGMYQLCHSSSRVCTSVLKQ